MYGRDGDLKTLHQIANDPSKPKFVRAQAERSKRKIIEQMRDKPLMAMREQLIKAARAGDDRGVAFQVTRMKAYEGQDPETGI